MTLCTSIVSKHPLLTPHPHSDPGSNAIGFSLKELHSPSQASRPSESTLSVCPPLHRRDRARRLPTSFKNCISTIQCLPSECRLSTYHLRAGFLQKSNSFCAIPTALLFAASPLISVRSRASAMEQMTALFGSAARWPQVSVWSKPLSKSSAHQAFRSIATKWIRYPAVSISIKCCSVLPASSDFLSPEKMPSWRSNALPAARLTSIISCASMSRLGGIA